MAEHAANRFHCQFGTPLLQPEMPADQQQHRAVHRVGHLTLLHQPLGIAQLHKGLGVIATVGGQQSQSKKSVKHAFVLAVQAHLQARLETLGGQAVLPLPQRQVPTPQGDASDQGPGLEPLFEQH